MDVDETFREAACLGNLQWVRQLLQMGASVNSQNKMNGWTALHWACKRGHCDVVQLLLDAGANATIITHKGETPTNLTSDENILKLLPIPDGGKKPSITMNKSELPVIPHYLQYPQFPYSDLPLHQQTSRLVNKATSSQFSELSIQERPFHDSGNCSSELTVRVRIADSGETDFVEVDVKELTYLSLLKCCCEELEVPLQEVLKLRKLPNVLVRKDKDVSRLGHGQELEMVLRSCKN